MVVQFYIMRMRGTQNHDNSAQNDFKSIELVKVSPRMNCIDELCSLSLLYCSQSPSVHTPTEISLPPNCKCPIYCRTPVLSVSSLVSLVSESEEIEEEKKGEGGRRRTA